MSLANFWRGGGSVRKINPLAASARGREGDVDPLLFTWGEKSGKESFVLESDSHDITQGK